MSRQATRDAAARAEGFRTYGHKRYVQEHPTSESAKRTVRANPALAPPKMPLSLKRDLVAQHEGWHSAKEKYHFWREVRRVVPDEAKDDRGKLLPEVRELVQRGIDEVQHRYFVKGVPVMSEATVSLLKDLLGNDAHTLIKMMYG